MPSLDHRAATTQWPDEPVCSSLSDLDLFASLLRLAEDRAGHRAREQPPAARLSRLRTGLLALAPADRAAVAPLLCLTADLVDALLAGRRLAVRLSVHGPTV